MSKPTNIIESFKILKGNTRVSIMFEPLWGIPFVLFNFYLSLYMKAQGITDTQIGYLISIGFFAGAVYSVFAGVITDKLGRKRTTLIFDLVSWPLAILIYVFADNFLMFALAVVINSLNRVVSVSWMMMIVEDANSEQRVSAFNLINIINISTGVIIPLAGIVVSFLGVVRAERIFMLFAVVSMSTMIILRNRFYKETITGQQILDERCQNNSARCLKDMFPLKALRILKKSPLTIIAISVFVLFNVYIPLGTFNSLYFAPYMTEVLMLSKSTISILGGVFSAVMFIVFVFVNPIISKFSNIGNMIKGLMIQAIALFCLMIIPTKSLFLTITSIVLFAIGFGIFRPFLDSLLAEVTEGKERAGVYSIVNLFTCLITGVIGFLSGSMYTFNPRSLYFTSIAILLICVCMLILYSKSKKRSGGLIQRGGEVTERC